MDASIVNKTECVAALSAILSFFSPMYFDTTDVIPAPRLVPMLIIEPLRLVEAGEVQKTIIRII